jgi:16S rRNA (cytosine1402-N4)-methyltransferase
VLHRPSNDTVHTRRSRYGGRSPRGFHEKYKELNPERYPEEAQKVLASGKTPAGTHRPIMVAEVLEYLRPAAGEIAVDCTLGGGGHARAILECVQPGGRLIGLDVDPVELPRTEARFREAGVGSDTFCTHRGNFAGLPKVLAEEGLPTVDVILADLGVSSMQLDNPDRGFSHRAHGPLDMRMNPTRGESASQLLMRVSEAELEQLLTENADEPHAGIIARVLKQQPIETTQAVDRLMRAGITDAFPNMAKPELKLSVRRTLQAIRIAVNDELSALDAFLRTLPACLAPGGRVAVLTFHSGEDRRVKKAFQAGHRAGVYMERARTVIRPSKEETFANRRASSAKLRWAVRA